MADTDPERKTPRRPLWDDPGPDRGWSWVIFVCSCIFLALSFGLCTTGSIGILFVEFVAVFHVSRKDAAWPFSIIGIMQCTTGIMSGFVNHWFDLRTVLLFSATCSSLALVLCFWATDMTYVTLTFGILFGCGYGLYMIVSLIYLNQYFKKYLASANGFFMVMSPVSGLVLPYLVNSLINTYGLRGAFLMLGGIAMQQLIVALLMKPRTPDHFPVLATTNPLIAVKTAEQRKERKIEKLCSVLVLYKSVVSDPMFYLVTTQSVVTLNVFVGFSLTVPDFAMDNQLTREDGIVLLTAFSVADIIGRGGFGMLMDYKWFNRVKYSLVSMLVQGISLMLFAVRREVVWFATISFILGLNEGGLATTTNVHYAFYFDKKLFPSAIGLRVFINGLLAFARPITAGYLRDSYSSYIPFYYLLGSLSLFSALLWSLEPLIMRFKRKQHNAASKNLESAS